MAVLITMPKETEDSLRAQWGDLEQAAKEALLLESYRAGKISIGRLAETLGVGVVEADRWLGDRGVALNYSAEDLDADRRALDGLLGRDGA